MQKTINEWLLWIHLWNEVVCVEIYLDEIYSLVMHWSHINAKAHKGHASYTNKKCTPWHILLFDIKYHTLTNLLSCTFILKRKAQSSMWYFYILKDTHLIYGPWSMTLFQEDKTRQQLSQKILYQGKKTQDIFLLMLVSMHKT